MSELIDLPALVLDEHDGSVLGRYPSVERAREDGWPLRHAYLDSLIIDTSSVPEAKRDLLTRLIAHAWDKRTHRGYLLALIAAPEDGETVFVEDVPIPKGVSARVAAALIEDMLWLRQPVPVEGFAPQFPNAYQARRDTDARAAVIRARRRNSLEAQLNQRLPGNIVARERKK